MKCLLFLNASELYKYIGSLKLILQQKIYLLNPSTMRKDATQGQLFKQNPTGLSSEIFLS